MYPREFNYHKVNISTDVFTYGYFNIVKLKNFPFDNWQLEEASDHGHLKTIQYLLNKIPRVPSWLMFNLVQGGYLNVLQYLVSRGSGITHDLNLTAIGDDWLEICKYLLTPHIFIGIDRYVIAAIQADSSRILRLLLLYEPPNPHLEYALCAGSLNCVRVILRSGATLPEEPQRELYERILNLKLLRMVDLPQGFVRKILNFAIRRNRDDIVEYLLGRLTGDATPYLLQIIQKEPFNTRIFDLIVESNRSLNFDQALTEGVDRIGLDSLKKIFRTPSIELLNSIIRKGVTIPENRRWIREYRLTLVPFDLDQDIHLLIDDYYGMTADIIRSMLNLTVEKYRSKVSDLELGLLLDQVHFTFSCKLNGVMRADDYYELYHSLYFTGDPLIQSVIPPFPYRQYPRTIVVDLVFGRHGTSNDFSKALFNFLDTVPIETQCQVRAQIASQLESIPETRTLTFLDLLNVLHNI